MILEKTIVIKPTLNCNLRCKYCYEFNRIDNSIINLKLDYNNIKIIIDKFSNLFPKSKINWLFHGGEPLLSGYSFYHNILNLINNVNNNKGVDYKVSIQTNGTIINDRLISLLENNLDIFGDRVLSISTDGPTFVDDKVRLSKSNKSVHNLILNSIYKIKKSKIDFTTISVIGSHNINYPKEVFEFLYEVNPNFIKMIPCYNFDKFGNKYNFGISPLEYADFMCKIFDMWIAKTDRDENRFVIDPIMTIISTITNSLSTWCEYRFDKCNNFITIYPNGDIFLCDNFNYITMKKYAFIGNIYTIDDSTLISSIINPNVSCKYNEFYDELMGDCKECNINNYCRGGCIQQRKVLKNISNDLYTEYCIAKEKLILYIKNAVDYALS